MARKNQKFYEIVNQSDDSKSVDILMYGSIPSWDEDTYKMKNSAESFAKELKNLEKDYDRINIHINSPGGSLYHAFPIFNAIRNSKKEIHTYNDGLAASAGGLLLLAGKKVHTAKNGILMIHNAMAWAYGNSDDFRETMKTLDTYDGIIAKLFAERTGMSEEDVKEKYLNYKDHWLDAEEALEAGFIDEIEEYESEDAPPSNITEMAFNEVLNLYRAKEEKSESFLDKVVNKVRAVMGADSKETAASRTSPRSDESDKETASTAKADLAVTEPQLNHKPKTDMDFKNALEILNKENPSAEELQAVKNDITAFTGANERFTAEEVTAKVDAAKQEIQNQLDAANTEKTNLENKVKDLEATVNSYKESGVTPSNVKDGKKDPIDADEQENLLTEADIEIRNMRKQMGIAAE
jgi:ATP-dependent Clp endopeptidase proteolytic subunit ClpP